MKQIDSYQKYKYPCQISDGERLLVLTIAMDWSSFDWNNKYIVMLLFAGFIDTPTRVQDIWGGR